MSLRKLLLINLLLLSFSCEVLAQVGKRFQISRTENYWSVGIQANVFNYFGDLNPINRRFSTEISFIRPNFGIEVTRKMGARLSIRGSLNYGRLKGDDFIAADPNNVQSAARYGRNLHFRNDIFEFSAVAMYEIFPNRGRFYRRRYLSPYLMAGIAVFYHNPKARVPLDFQGTGANPGDWVALQPLGTEGQGLPGRDRKYGLIQPAIPVGGGVRWRINDRMDVSFEMAFRILFFDHLDDVSGTYPDVRDLDSDLARALYDRSGEQVAASAEELRDLSVVIPSVGGLSTTYGAQGDFFNARTTPGFENLNRLSSYGIEGDQRGNASKANDVYLVTGFRLTYILTTRRFARLRRDDR